MGDVPEFQIAPPLRCYYHVGDRDPRVCGAPARWIRPGRNELHDGFFCDAHRERGDAPIPPSYLFRRVAITVQVLFSGVSLIPAVAQAEALLQLEAAVGGVGGVVNLHAMTSTLGRHTAPPPRQAGSGRPKGSEGRTLRH